MSWYRSVSVSNLIVTCSLLLAGFLAFSFIVQFDFTDAIDMQITSYIAARRTGVINLFFAFITHALSPFTLSVFALVIFIILLKHQHYFLAQLLSLSLLYAHLAFGGVKFLMERIRPAFSDDPIGGFSFPSGHATIAALFFLFIIGTFSQKVSGNKRPLFIAVNLLLMIAVCFSRIYLGVHWSADVIGGILLGCFVLVFTTLQIRISLIIGCITNSKE